MYIMKNIQVNTIYTYIKNNLVIARMMSIYMQIFSLHLHMYINKRQKKVYNFKKLHIFKRKRMKRGKQLLTNDD